MSCVQETVNMYFADSLFEPVMALPALLLKFWMAHRAEEKIVHWPLAVLEDPLAFSLPFGDNLVER